jgi:hypothetical protein
MKQRAPIRWHRFAAELCDQKILREIRALHAKYYETVRAKQHDQPFVEFEHLNLTAFTMRILESGIDVVAYQLRGKGVSIQHD